jgi:hypothetical protein
MPSAALAALGLQQRLHARGAMAVLPDVSLVGRIGLHTGSVAVGGLGDAPEATAAIVGDTVAVAMALQEGAAPGTIVCSAATARLMQGTVRLVARDPVAVGRQGAPLPVYEVRRRRGRQPPGLLLHGRPLSPFVGRERELVILQALLAQVEAGQGRVVGIMGDPGMGKSRLVTEFRRGLRGRRLTYLTGGCLAYGQHTPYLPVLSILRTHCGITSEDHPAVMATKGHRRLAEVDMAPEDWAAYLLRLLNVPTETAPLAALSPEVVKARTVDTLVQLARHGAR